MFVASYDNRTLLPSYMGVFLEHSTFHAQVHLLSPAKTIGLQNAEAAHLASSPQLVLLDPATLNYYAEAESLFDSVFLNFSTNPAAYEKACFCRWLALDLATCHLADNDYVCMLDTDFVLGMHPEDILQICSEQAGGSGPGFIGSWSEQHPAAIGPELAFFQKKYLFQFCRYLLSGYFDPTNHPSLRGQYYDRIAKGLAGGICDMRALAGWLRSHDVLAFNLNAIRGYSFVHNFAAFVQQQCSDAPGWEIVVSNGRQTLNNTSWPEHLIGIHFQGATKPLMELLRGATAGESRLSDSIISEFSMKGFPALPVRVMNRARRTIKAFLPRPTVSFY